MPAFVIFTRETTTDQAELDLYASLVPAARVGHDMVSRVRYGDFEMLEGDPIEGCVVIEFPSMAEARAWYHSPAYQAAAAHRFAGSRYRAFIVQGVE